MNYDNFINNFASLKASKVNFKQASKCFNALTSLLLIYWALSSHAG